MFTSTIRLLFIVVFLIYAVLLTWFGGIGQSWYVFIAVVLLLLAHFKYGSVWPAFRALQKGDFDKAEDIIHQVKRPDWLAKSAKGYYFLVKGLIAMNEKEFEESKQFLRKALETGLRTENDQGLVLLNMAHISYVQQKPNEAIVYIKEGKQLEINPFLKKKMEELEVAIDKNFKKKR
ncbi:MAG: hypothetical protein AAF502_13725 [Bacteroidota bacterium]